MKKLKLIRVSKIISVSILTLTTLILFNNCSDVGFEADQNSIVKQLSANSSIIINDGDLFTNKDSVILSIKSDNATEMMISNHPSIETSWEPYKEIRAWNLARVNSNVTIYVKFKTRGVTTKDWIHDDITHDNIKPVLTPSNPPTGYLNSSFSYININISENGSGVRDNFCSLNSANNQFDICSEGNKLKIGKDIAHTNDGPYQYYAYSIDRAGNKSDTLKLSWVADQTPPTVSFTGQLPSLTSSRSASISFLGSDATSGISHYLCRLGTSAFSRCESPYIKNSLADGVYQLSVKSVDRAGNTSAVQTHQWEVHTSAPVITFVQPLPSIISTAKNSQVGFIGKDKDFTMTSFVCSLNGSSFNSCTSPYTTGALTDRKHTLSVKGRGRLGQLSTAFSYSWTVDTSIKTPIFAKKPKKTSNEVNGNFQVGNLDPDVTHLYCKLDNTSYKACPSKSSFSFNNLSNGVHTLAIYAVDHVGNKSGTTSYSFTVDTIAPIISVTGPANNSLAMDKDKFIITASDNLTPVNELVYHCKIDSGAYKPCSKIFETPLAANVTHSFTAKVTDQVGNSTESSPYIYKTLTIQLSANFTKTPEKVNTSEDLIDFKFIVNNGGYPINTPTCLLQSEGSPSIDISCQPNQLVNLGKLPVKAYTIHVDIENTFGNKVSLSYDFEVQKVGECSGSQVCLVIKDDFERTDIRSGDFGWSSFLIDAWSSQGLDISTKSLGQASSGNSAAFFTGRRGGSVHGLFLNSKEINLSGYSSISIEFDYIMASFESWTYSGESGLENFKVDICTLGELECGVKSGSTNFTKMKDSTRWKTLYEKEASTPINQNLNGNNHTVEDYTNIKGNDLVVNLDNLNLVSDKSKVILRWSFKMDEGIVDENGNVNYVDGATPDAGILDNIVVKAYKN